MKKNQWDRIREDDKQYILNGCKLMLRGSGNLDQAEFNIRKYDVEIADILQKWINDFDQLLKHNHPDDLDVTHE